MDDMAANEWGRSCQCDFDAAARRSSTTPDTDGLHKHDHALMDAFVTSHPLPPSTEHATAPRLQHPIIIPQRRPRDWTRGFARAYAPVLADYGIDEDTFLDFLKTFNAVIWYLPWVEVADGVVRELLVLAFPILFFGLLFVSTAGWLGMEAHARTRTNSFLDRMNKEFFEPRGLYCLVLAYDPKPYVTYAPSDITRSISASMTPTSSVMGTMLKSVRLSSSNTHSVDLPEAAPLVFPTFDHKGSILNPIKWVQIVDSYVDGLFQAHYAKKKPPKALAVMAPRKQKQRSSRRAWWTKKKAGGATSNEELENQPRVPRKGTGRRWYRGDVMYLMIVNVPTEAEWAAVRVSPWVTR